MKNKKPKFDNGIDPYYFESNEMPIVSSDLEMLDLENECSTVTTYQGDNNPLSETRVFHKLCQ